MHYETDCDSVKEIDRVPSLIHSMHEGCPCLVMTVFWSETLLIFKITLNQHYKLLNDQNFSLHA